MATKRKLAMATLGMALGGLLLGTGCRGNRSEAPPVHLQQNMDFAERGGPQERNDFFENGRAMRLPPAGTVAVGFLKSDKHLHFGQNPDGTLADGLPKAIELDEAALVRGEERYNIYCAPCHGNSGRGDGPVTRRGGGMGTMPPAFHLKKLQPAPLGYFFRVITFGKGTMQPYASQVPVEDRWLIAAWIRVLQMSHQATSAEVASAGAKSQKGRQGS